jgi:asparagine synthase (glutamine-hydrolysing)
MCGIGGIVRYGGGLDRESARLLRFRERLRHRGPDGEGMYIGEHAALIHTRLALRDPSGGAQPLRSPDGRYTLVYNGEVYNVGALRDELRDHWVFRSRCDTEVVLAAYAHWGAGCVPRLNGMFAFFVWDAVQDTGFAARDLLGVKPFVYTQTADAVLFASEAKALLPELASTPSLRLDALLEYLVVPCFSGVEAPLFEGLATLPPGHCLEVSRAGTTVWAWGRYTPEDDERAPSPEALRATLAAAVKRTSIADAPVGVYLSGGLDSSLIAALMTNDGASPRAFTISFADQNHYDYDHSLIVTSDDGPFASQAAAYLGLDHEIVSVDRGSLADDLATLAAHNDALPAWEQEVAQHRLARAAGARCKAVLVGDAADETHYGYHFLLDAAASNSPRGIIERFTAAIVCRDVLPDPVEYFDAKYRRLTEEAGFGWERPSDQIRATTWLILRRWLPRLLHNGDIHAMAHSLEARVPFADTELLELARRVPATVGLRGGIEKWLLREAGRGLIPESIRRRTKSALPKDQGVAALLQREAVRALDDTAPVLGKIVDLKRARSLCDPRRVPDERQRALLFRLVCLAHWVRVFQVRMP